jgi:hypothetical protein
VAQKRAVSLPDNSSRCHTHKLHFFTRQNALPIALNNVQCTLAGSFLKKFHCQQITKIAQCTTRKNICAQIAVIICWISTKSVIETLSLMFDDYATLTKACLKMPFQSFVFNYISFIEVVHGNSASYTATSIIQIVSYCNNDFKGYSFLLHS